MMSTLSSLLMRMTQLRVGELASTLTLMSCPGYRFRAGGERSRSSWFVEDLERIRRAEISLVVCCAEPHELAMPARRVSEAMVRIGASFRFASIEDMKAPSPEQATALDRALEELISHLRLGRNAAIHCKAGIGRTGLAATRLLQREGLSAAQALARIRAVHHPEAVETVEQLRFLGIAEDEMTGLGA